MSTIIDCRKHNYGNYYTYTVSKDIDTEDESNSFQIDVDFRINGWHESQTMWQPKSSGIVINYDSIDIDLSHHSESEKKMIMDWIELAINNETFEDSFMKEDYKVA